MSEFQEEAWGPFPLRNPPPPTRTKGAASLPGIPEPRPSPSPLHLLGPVAWSTWSAQAVRPEQQHPECLLPRNPPAASGSPPRAPALPCETTANASRESLLPSPSSQPRAPSCGKASHTEGAEAGRWGARGTGGGPRVPEAKQGQPRREDASRKPSPAAGFAWGAAPALEFLHRGTWGHQTIKRGGGAKCGEGVLRGSAEARFAQAEHGYYLHGRLLRGRP